MVATKLSLQSCNITTRLVTPAIADHTFASAHQQTNAVLTYSNVGPDLGARKLISMRQVADDTQFFPLPRPVCDADQPYCLLGQDDATPRVVFSVWPRWVMVGGVILFFLLGAAFGVIAI